MRSEVAAQYAILPAHVALHMHQQCKIWRKGGVRMKAMLLKGKNQPLVLDTVPDPVPGPGEAVARVLACGAGLTVHHARAGRVPIQYPLKSSPPALA